MATQKIIYSTAITIMVMPNGVKKVGFVAASLPLEPVAFAVEISNVSNIAGDIFFNIFLF